MRAVRTGIDLIASGEAVLAAAGRFGLVTNGAARTSEGEWTGDALAARLGEMEALAGTEVHEAVFISMPSPGHLCCARDSSAVFQSKR